MSDVRKKCQQINMKRYPTTSAKTKRVANNVNAIIVSGQINGLQPRRADKGIPLTPLDDVKGIPA